MAALTLSELAVLRQLMARRDQGLSSQEQARLRSLLAKENPSAFTMPWEELVSLGLLVLGLIALYQIIKKT